MAPERGGTVLTRRGSIGCLALLATFAMAPAARAQGVLDAALTGFEEVPAISTQGKGKFEGTLSANENQIEWQLSWNNKLEGSVTQAHIHFAQPGVNGAIVVFLCTNLGNGPAGTQACPASPASIQGTILKADVTGIGDLQGISAGQLRELVRAIKAGTAYVNVHTSSFSSGEIRGQIEFTATM